MKICLHTKHALLQNSLNVLTQQEERWFVPCMQGQSDKVLCLIHNPGSDLGRAFLDRANFIGANPWCEPPRSDSPLGYPPGCKKSNCPATLQGINTLRSWMRPRPSGTDFERPLSSPRGPGQKHIICQFTKAAGNRGFHSIVRTQSPDYFTKSSKIIYSPIDLRFFEIRIKGQLAFWGSSLGMGVLLTTE